MAFVVEDGSGLPDSNAYITIAFADSYHSDRGNSTWTGADSVKQSAIIRATDYIDKRFGIKFKGYRKIKEQALEWPRLDAYSPEGWAYTNPDDVPRKLQQACAEYALRSLIDGELAPDPDDQISGSLVLNRVKVGPIEEEKQFKSDSASKESLTSIVSASSIQEYPAADLLIQELLRSISSRRLVRG